MVDNTDIFMAKSIFHNNKAAKHLHNGEYHDAISCLVTSLASIKRALQQLPPGNKNESYPCHDISGQLDTARVPCHYHQHVQQQQQNHQNHDEMEPSYLFAYATIVTHIDVDDEKSCLMACNAMSGIILWNLALAHHLYYLCSNTHDMEQRESYLQKAKRFYESSYQIHVNAGGHAMIDWTRAIPILNNLAIVNETLRFVDQAKTCQRTLLSMIFYYTDARRIFGVPTSWDKNNETCFVQENDMVGILGNISNLILTHAVTAQAA